MNVVRYADACTAEGEMMMDERALIAKFETIRRAAHLVLECMARRYPELTRAMHRMIRIEVDHDAEYALHLVLDRYYPRANLRGPVGPMRLDDFDVYVVHQLPEPGWRIINPFPDALAANG